MPFRPLLPILGLLLAASSACPRAVDRKEVSLLAASCLREIADIRGIPIKREIPVLFKDAEFLRAHYRRNMARQVPPDRIDGLLKAAQALGFLEGAPAGDPVGEEEEGFLHGVRGIYDPEAKAVYIPERADDADMEMYITHEMVHALQDQSFGLGDYLDSLGALSYDERYARACVVEGEAVALTLEWSLRRKGRTLAESAPIRRLSEVNADIERGRAWFRGERFRTREDAMDFVYAYGAAFFQDLLRARGWGSLDEVHRHPPRSTAEIIHPERYLAGDLKRVRIRIRGLEGEDKPLAGYRKVWEDVLGEYGLSLVLGSRLDPSRAHDACQGWRGDRLQVYEGKDGGLVLVGYVVFEGEEEAGRFLRAWRESIERMAGTTEAAILEGERYRVRAPATGAWSHLEARGAHVVIVENAGKRRLESLLEALLPKDP